MTYSKLLNFVPTTKSVASTGLAVLRQPISKVLGHMMLFIIDSEGWTEAHESMDSIESSVEFIDVSSDEYIVIDSSGFLYSWSQSSTTRCCFELKRTVNKDPALLTRIQSKQTNYTFKI